MKTSSRDEEIGLLASKESFRSYQSHFSPTEVQDYPIDYPKQIEFASPKESKSSDYPSKKKKTPSRRSLWSHIDPNAFQFGLRMAVLLTLSSLFVLIRTEDYRYPDAMWVLVSVLFVCWFPSLDAASVIEKIIQRLIGTFVGAFLGLGCGFLSLLFPERVSQAVFLSICMFVFNFLIIFLAGQCKVGPLKVIRRFAYATILCVLTFCICMLPFSLDADPKWETGVWRVINVVVGCLLGAVGSIVVCPKSTTNVLLNKTAKQVQLAGEASEAILHTASDFFAGRVQVSRLADELLTAPLESTIRWKLMRSGSSLSGDSNSNNGNLMAKADVALKKYEDAIGDWRVTKMLFPLTHYDPFSLSITEATGNAKAAQTEIARTLARALRIQTTIVVLDGMVRSDAEYVFSKREAVLFFETGSLIKEMLTIAQGDRSCVPSTLVKTDGAATQLFDKLDETRERIMSITAAITSSEGERGLEDFKADLLGDGGRTEEEDDMGRGIPKNATGSHDNSLFFLQLVEHLILRSLRLYQAWKHVELEQLQQTRLKEAAYM